MPRPKTSSPRKSSVALLIQRLNDLYGVIDATQQVSADDLASRLMMKSLRVEEQRLLRELHGKLNSTLATKQLRRRSA